ncbi:MAG: hypothetical protein IJS74_03270, partial [Clostridia bacterium]|nr:hypothetical protein [Clostridia bacterium]
MSKTRKTTLGGGGYRLLISIILAVFAVALTIGLIFVNKGRTYNQTIQPSVVEETDTKDKTIPGVYYATAQEVEESGVAQVPMSEKGGAIYVGSGSTYTMSGGCIKSQHA